MFKKACIVLWVNEKLREVRTVQYAWPKVCRNLHNTEMDSAGTGMLKGSTTTSGDRWCGAPCTINIIIRGVPLYFPTTLHLRTKKSAKKYKYQEKKAVPLVLVLPSVRLVSSSPWLWLCMVSLNCWRFLHGSVLRTARCCSFHGH